MNIDYNLKLRESYSNKITHFANSIKEFADNSLPVPFIPVIGKNYGIKLPKILFLGWETRGSKNLADWVKEVEEFIEKAFTWYGDEFTDLEYLNWKINFNNDFWSFNLKLLGKIHNIKDWRDLYRDPDAYFDILSSFAWANTDSIERYEVTAQKLGARQEDWARLKEASRIFDNFKLLTDTLEPEIVVLMNGEMSEDWLLNDIKIKFESEPQEFLWYYECEEPKMHLFWTSHPRGHQQKGINQNQLVDNIVSIYRSHIKNIQ